MDGRRVNSTGSRFSVKSTALGRLAFACQPRDGWAGKCNRAAAHLPVKA
jgi:hypothetical protein